MVWKFVGTTIATVTACLMVGTFLACGVGILGIPRDDCMDNSIFYALETDGISLFAKNPELQSHKAVFLGDKYIDQDRPQISVQYNQSTASLDLKYGEVTRSIPTGDSTAFIWSRRYQTLYFLVTNPGLRLNGIEQPSRTSFCSWNLKQGFRSLLSVNDPYLKLSESLDQEAITAVTSGLHTKEATEILVVNSKLGTHSFAKIPDQYERALLLKPNQYLLWRHDSGHDGQEYMWSTGQTGSPKPINLDGPIVDAVILNGELWGLSHVDGLPTIVHINPDLSKAEKVSDWPNVD